MALSAAQQKEQSERKEARKMKLFIHNNSRELRNNKSKSGIKALTARKDELEADWAAGARETKDVIGIDADQSDEINALKKKITALTTRSAKAETKISELETANEAGIDALNKNTDAIAVNFTAIEFSNTNVTNVQEKIDQEIVSINGRITKLENPA